MRGTLGKGFETLEELMLLKQLGILDGDKNDDQLTKILGFMSLNSNRYMEQMKDYVKESKDDDDDNGRGRRRRKKGNGGGDFIHLLQGFNSAQLSNLYAQIDQQLQGVASGPNLSTIGVPAGYTLANWGNDKPADSKIIIYILNTLNFLAYLMSAQSQAERTEAGYTLLEAFDGSKMWGNEGNLAGLLPLALLSGGGGGFFPFALSLQSGALQIPKAKWSA